MTNYLTDVFSTVSFLVIFKIVLPDSLSRGATMPP